MKKKNVLFGFRFCYSLTLTLALTLLEEIE
jgi:hypothetical protein